MHETQLSILRGVPRARSITLTVRHVAAQTHWPSLGDSTVHKVDCFPLEYIMSMHPPLGVLPRWN